MKTSVTLVAGQDIETPITLEGVKLHLGISHDDQDEMLRAQILSALSEAEAYTRRAIVSRQYLITRDKFPRQVWELPLGRITAIDSVQYKDSNGTTQTWGSSPITEYQTDLDTDFRPRLRPTSSWPSIGDYMSAARVTVTAGWANADIPYSINQALKLLVGAAYYTRVPGDDDPEDIQTAAELLLDQWSLPIW